VRSGSVRSASVWLAVQLGRGITEAPASRPQLRRWIQAALQRPATLTLRFVASAEARALNSGFRGRDYVPDVLTFSYPDDQGRLQADIVVCLPVVRRQARSAGIPFAWRLAHLIMHGALHAQGWDHETDSDARAMESLEARLLARFRIPDPYQ
jgi:probable rRNA maturation factor